MRPTGLEEFLGIEYPILLAPLGPWSSARLTAAVSNVGGLGTLGTARWSLEQVREQLARLQDLTDRPFAVNLSLFSMEEQVLELVLDARPAVISFAHGDPGHLPARAHDAGCLVMHMVNTVTQARQAAEREVDVLIAQGSEAAGFGGNVGTMALVPEVVQAVQPIPVVASGGIADGRGVAAALMLGAQGISLGTRFLASTEASIPDEWKQDIVHAQAEDAVQVDFADLVMGEGKEGSYPLTLRCLRSPFVNKWNRRREEAEREAPRLREQFDEAVRQNRAHELFPFAGQSVGLIHDILPAGEIVRQLVAEADRVLQRPPIPEPVS